VVLVVLQVILHCSIVLMQSMAIIVQKGDMFSSNLSLMSIPLAR
jgi:hypothetical protein